MKAPIRRRDQDEDSDNKDDETACNMTGESLEQLPFPVIINSGACISVMPTSWCSHVPTEETPESWSGESFRAANGDKISHEGRTIISIMAKEGARRNMWFIACEVSKARGSVSQSRRVERSVVYHPSWHEDGSHMQREETGEGMWLCEHNGLYVLDTRVAPQSKQTSTHRVQDSGRQANP